MGGILCCGGNSSDDELVIEGGKPIVTITGVTGYLGAHVCRVFLQDRKYQVRGTVRDLSNAAKIDPIKKSLGGLFNKLDLVEADLMD